MRYWFSLALLLTSQAYAGVVTVAWTNPTLYTNGTPVLPADISKTRVEYGNCTQGRINEKMGEFSTTGAATSASSPNLAISPYAYCFRAFTTANGVESVPSVVVSITVTTGTSPCTHPASPALTQIVQCTLPAIGSWAQTRSCTESACPIAGGPTTWTCGAWAPATAPSGACVTPPPPTEVWKVAPNGTATTRVTWEKIRDPTDTQWIAGYQLGTIPIGKLCGPVKEIASTTEYHSVLESDTTLQSVTYRGRSLVARCVKVVP